MRLRSCLIALGFAATAVVSTVPAASAAPHVRFLGETTLPHGLQFQGTAVGGLSGVDRDPRTGGYVLISDDRGYTNPPRFYTAELEVDASGVHDVRLTGTHALRHPDGGAYSSPALNDGRAVDPEEIRIDPLTGDYWWSQEGDRPTAAGAPVIQPSVQRARRDGAYAADLPLPANYAITPDRGPRRNLALERSWVPGADYKVRLFQVDIAGATDVRDQDVIADDVRPVRKKQLADLDDFPLPVIDNVEGLTWGPRLPTGERTLLLVSDDNFAAEEFTRFIALALR